MEQSNNQISTMHSQADILLNSKSEFHQAPLTRLVAFTGLHNDQGEEQAGQVFLGLERLELVDGQGQGGE